MRDYHGISHSQTAIDQQHIGHHAGQAENRAGDGHSHDEIRTQAQGVKHRNGRLVWQIHAPARRC